MGLLEPQRAGTGGRTRTSRARARARLTLTLRATRLGLSGVPVAAETIALHTIFELLKTTGTRVHLCRISSAAGVELVRRAKADGLKVTADVSINSLHLTDVDIGFFDSNARLTPLVGSS